MLKDRQVRSQQAVRAAVALAEQHGLKVTGPTVLADLFSVMVHLRPTPVVARVSTYTSKMRVPISDWLRREIDVTSFLSGQGAPVVAPSIELPPGPHEYDGFPISFWTYLQPVEDRTPTMADCAAMLPDLHAAMRSYSGDLPLLAPVANEIPKGLAILDQVNEFLTDKDIDHLRAAAEQLQPFWQAPPGDLQPLHGDVHFGNLIATKDGLVWIDFEDTCRGPVEWDLALSSWMDPDAGRGYDPEILMRCSQLRALHLILSMIAFRPDFGDVADWDSNIRWFFEKLPAV